MKCVETMRGVRRERVCEKEGKGGKKSKGSRRRTVVGWRRESDLFSRYSKNKYTKSENFLSQKDILFEIL